MRGEGYRLVIECLRTSQYQQRWSSATGYQRGLSPAVEGADWPP